MRQSRDRILTSHAGSLPRPDDLIEANQSREAGTVTDERGILGPARIGRGGRGAAAAGGGHRRSRRRRVRQGDGASRQLPRLVELLVPAPRRPRAGHAGALRRAADPVEPRQRRAHELRRSPRSPALRGRVRGSRVRHHDRTPPAALARLRRSPHLYRARGDPGRRPALEGGPRRRRRRGGLHDLHRARQRLPHRQPPLPDGRGIPLRLRRRHARGVPGHRRRGAHPAARRSGHRRELGHGQSGAHRRGLPAVLDGARGGAQPRHPRPARGPHPLSPLLGKLARAPHDRRPDAGHRRRDARRQVPRLLVRGRQCPPRARVEGVARRRAARGQDHPAGHREPRHQRRRASGAGGGAHRALRGRGRPGAGHRLHRLRPRRARPPADRVGQARIAGSGRGPGHAPALALGRTERPSRGRRGPCTQRTPNGRIVDHGQEQEGVRARHRGEPRAGRRVGRRRRA